MTNSINSHHPEFCYGTPLRLEPPGQAIETRPGADFGARRFDGGIVHAELEHHRPALLTVPRRRLDGHFTHGPGVHQNPKRLFGDALHGLTHFLKRRKCQSVALFPSCITLCLREIPQKTGHNAQWGPLRKRKKTYDKLPASQQAMGVRCFLVVHG